jgi:transposase
MNTTNTYTMGLDLGDRRSTYCLLDASGKTVDEAVVATSQEGLEALSKQHCGAMETGTHSPWVSRLFEAAGHKVYVANARKLRALSASNIKSDLDDARMLACLARVDLLPSFFSPMPAARPS